MIEGRCPEALGIDQRAASRDEVRQAAGGSFEILGRKTFVRSPVDWTQNLPVDSHRFRQDLFKLRFLAPLLSAHAVNGSRKALRVAIPIALDFADQQARFAPSTAPEAWIDKVVGDRVANLAYLTRAGACEGMLSTVQAGALFDSLAQHAEYLTDPSRYTPDNHGLFADRGLLLLSRYLPFAPEADTWRELAIRRFSRTLRGRLSGGMWLEHSSAYQFLVLSAVRSFNELAGGVEHLGRALRRMKEAAGWHVEPDRMIAQFGDSNQEPAPGWAIRKARDTRGVRGFFGAGFASARARGPGGTGYLGVTAGFHNLVHKHADELSFELYDRGTRIVADTGLFHKDPGRVRRFVVSPEAHSTLTVDDRPWPIADNSNDYGSGLLAVGRADGWFAIQARNPLVEEQGVHHERLFLYRPGEVLVIVDQVRSREAHRYDRRIQLGPRISASRTARGVRLEAKHLRGFLRSHPAGRAEPSVVEGLRSPLNGLTSPAFREFQSRPTLSWSAQARSPTYVTSISLGKKDWKAVPAAESDGDALKLRAGQTESALVVQRDRRRLTPVWQR